MKAKLDELTDRAGHAVRENVAHIIFGAVIALMICVSFVEMGAGDGKINWLGMTVNILLQVSVFVPYRWRQKRLTGQTDPYKANRRLCGEKVEELHKNNALNDFSRFCEVKTKELKREKALQIAHAAGVDTVDYDLYCAGKPTNANLDGKQRQALERAKRVKVKAINPLCITSNSSRVKGYGIDFDEGLEDAKGIAGKIFPMLVWGVILAYIAIDGIHYGGLSAVVVIIFRIVMCLTAMFSGIMSGEGFVIKRDKVMLRRIDFIELFHEWSKVPKPEAEEVVEQSLDKSCSNT